MYPLSKLLICGVVAVFVCGTAMAQDDQELAKQSQNPLATMISLPLQNNTDFDAGPQDKTTTNSFNIQPVYPWSFGKVNLISRAIVPIAYQGEFVTDRPSCPKTGTKAKA